MKKILLIGKFKKDKVTLEINKQLTIEDMLKEEDKGNLEPYQLSFLER